MIADEDGARAWLGALPGYDAVADRLARFVAMLAEENRRQNLVAEASVAHVWQRHIADSAQLLAYVPRGTSRWLDLGTGAGFPGIIVAALLPDISMTMVESRLKRASWLETAISTLELANASVWAYDVKTLPSETYDVISARAFAPLDRLLTLAARFSTSGTMWLLPKGRSAGDELAGLSGWRHAFHVERSLTDPDAGIITGHLLGPKDQRG